MGGTRLEDDLGEFQTSMRKLQTAALVARLPRDAVWEYAVLAQAARWLSEEEWERTGDPETGGGIDGYLAEAAREAARAVAAIAWSPAPMHTWRWRRAKKRVDDSSLSCSPRRRKAWLPSHRSGPGRLRTDQAASSRSANQVNRRRPLPTLAGSQSVRR